MGLTVSILLAAAGAILLWAVEAECPASTSMRSA